MASGLYDKAREQFLAGNYDWDGDDMRAVFIDVADYTVNLATHDFLDDVAAAARVGTPAALTGKTVTAGVADANDTTLTSVSGDQFEAVIIFNEGGGTDATRELIAYIDSIAATTPNGGNITIVWDNGANKIFKL